MKPPSRQRSPLLATVRAMASACASSRNRGSRDQRHPLQGEADGIEAGDLLPGVRRASAVNQSTWLRKWVTPFAAAPGQRGGRLGVEYPPWTSVGDPHAWRGSPAAATACAGRQRSIVNVLSRWAWGSTRPGSVRAPARSPQAGSRLVGWGQCGDPAVAKGQVRQQRFTVGLRRPAVGQRPGRESGAADTGERRARGGSVIVSLLTDPKPEAGISPANSRA